MRYLLKEGRLEFNLGGWVMADEAATTYTSIITQLTEGHEYLTDILGAKPRVAWQIDPFGHSEATPELFALAGFDALVGNRILYSQKEDFKRNLGMEFVWQGHTPIDGKPARMFTHILDSHYSSPSGFDWEGWSWAKPPPDLNASTVATKAKELAAILKERASWFATSKLLIPLGDDFKFRNATAEFYNWDQLVAYSQQHAATLGVRLRCVPPKMFRVA